MRKQLVGRFPYLIAVSGQLSSMVALSGLYCYFTVFVFLYIVMLSSRGNFGIDCILGYKAHLGTNFKCFRVKVRKFWIVESKASKYEGSHQIGRQRGEQVIVSAYFGRATHKYGIVYLFFKANTKKIADRLGLTSWDCGLWTITITKRTYTSMTKFWWQSLDYGKF